MPRHPISVSDTAPTSSEGADADGATPLGHATAILSLTRDQSARDLLMEVSIQRGYGLCCACDAAEAIRILSSEPPALVIVDIDTPDGRAFVRTLRSEERWRGMPLFALTATNNSMVGVTIDAPVFFKPDLSGLEEAVVGRFESAEQRIPVLEPWFGRTPSA